MQLNKSTAWYCAAVLCLQGFIINPVLAARNSAGAVSGRLQQSQEYREQLQQQEEFRGSERVEPEIIIDDLLEDDKKPAESQIKFQLNGIVTDESSILTEQDIETIIKDHVGRIITISELNNIVAEFNELYRLKGYLAAKAILPSQKLTGGVVKIKLIEGRIGQVKIDGNKTTNDGFILDWVDVKEGDLVQIQRLENKLRKLMLLSDIQARAALKPGEKVGETDYLLDITEPEQKQTILFSDNAGTDDVGLYRVGFNHVNHSVTGKRDRLTLGGYTAEGTKSIYAGYQFPINSLGSSISLNADYNEIEIIDGPLEPLDITGDSYNLGIGLSHPLRVSEDSVLYGLMGANTKQSQTHFSGVTLFDTDVNSIYFGASWQAYSPSSVSYARIIGTAADESWTNPQSFFKVNVDYSYNRKFYTHWLATLRFSGQWSDSELLPSSEQFQVGGMSTVRGYPEGLLIGDDGYMASVELSRSLGGRLGEILGGNSRGLVFLDHGSAIPFKGNGEKINSDDYITSVGGGLDINLGDSVSARLLVGIPTSSRDDGEDDPTFNFYVQARF
ncbi:MAG: BamA/TamA family outer membrane protein [Gammaproteobacteria bacterium]|nr:BamA/TamA family outer membrane protein [Gammaproteobacteria bacterium]